MKEIIVLSKAQYPTDPGRYQYVLSNGVKLSVVNIGYTLRKGIGPRTDKNKKLYDVMERMGVLDDWDAFDGKRNFKGKTPDEAVEKAINHYEWSGPNELKDVDTELPDDLL